MLDLKDRRILAALDQDSRLSFSEIGRRVGLPQETVRYRYNQLVKRGTIQHFATFINGPKVGYTYFEMLFKLHNISRQRYEEILRFFCDQPRVSWVAELEGSYDVAIIVCARHQLQIQQLIDALYAKYSDCILDKELSINLRGELFRREWLAGEQRTVPPNIPIYVYDEVVELEPHEDEICRQLCIDARTSAVDLARQTGVSVETVVQTIRRLRKENVILGHTITMDLDQLGVSHYKILLTLNNTAEKDVKAFEAYARARPRVLGLFRSLAHYDYQIDVEVESVRQLKEITMELNAHFSHIVHDYSVLRIARMPKYAFYP